MSSNFDNLCCELINDASLIYADALNANLMKYATTLVKSFGLKSKPMIAPYAYFYYSGFDIDIRNKMVPFSYPNGGDVDLFDGDAEDQQNLTSTYELILQNYAKGWKRARLVLGLIGVTMVTTGKDDPNDNSAHYISYVLVRGTRGNPNKLFIFDSAGWGKKVGLPDDSMFRMVKQTFRISDSDVIRNKGVFETAGGESSSEYTYVGQNIFCHTWSMWFWHQLLQNNLSMEEIDKLAGKGTLKNQQNLIRIKNYIYNSFVPTVKLKFESERDRAIFMANFRYIFKNKESLKIEIIPI